MQLLAKISKIFGGEKALSLSLLDAPAYPFRGDTWLQRFDLTRPMPPLRYNAESAFQAYSVHELVYSCINKLADVMNDAEIIVETQGKDGNWEKKEGHLLPSLFKRPNPVETGRDFRRMIVQSEQSTGIFYAEITRSGAGLPVELHPLNPLRIQLFPNFSTGQIAFYRYTRPDGKFFDILPENMLIRRRADITNRFFGLSPLEVALKSINSDLGLTDYVNAFFDSDGTPSGILRLLNQTVPEVKRKALQALWKAEYGRNGSNQKGVAVLDQNADYQSIGSKLNELDTDKISDRFESRICSVFGVPPILVGAWVGLRHTTANATAKAALRDFWDNKVSPELAILREWLTWFVLPEFESINAIKAEKVRVNWDISHVAFLQEDADGIHTRARENFKAGFWTLNEAREATGMPPDEVAGSDYYVQPLNVVAISPQIRATEAEKEPQPAPQALPRADGQNADTGQAGATGDGTKPKALPERVEKKTFDLNGLTIAREPQGVELLIDLKSVAQDYADAKTQAIKIVKRFRDNLIDQSAKQIEKFDANTVYRLTLSPDPQIKKELKKAIKAAYISGRKQVARELAAQSKADNPLDGEDDLTIDELVDLLVSRVINEMQHRAINLYTTLKLLLDYSIEKLKAALSEQSDKFVEQMAGNTANAAIQSGRTDEANARSDEWETVQYSAILDVNTCNPCADADGMEAADEADLPDAPNPECDGGANCRCFHIFVAKSEAN